MHNQVERLQDLIKWLPKVFNKFSSLIFQGMYGNLSGELLYEDIKQLMNEAEYLIKNYGDWGGRSP